MDEWKLTAVKSLIGLTGAGVGALVNHVWQRRNTSDRELFLLLRQAFDRPAFRGPYMYQSDHSAFQEAVTIVLKTVETGKYFDRDGKEVGELDGRYRGPFSIRNHSRRKVLEDVRDRLQRILHFSKQIAKVPKENVAEIVKRIDDDRDVVVRSLNGVWKSFGFVEMRIPTEVILYEEVREPPA